MLPSETKTATYQLNVESDVSIAVAQVYSLPELKRVNQNERSLIATMVSELGTNVIKYAGSGTVRLRMDKDYNQLKVTLVAEDRGPGISDIDTAMKDHFSTGGTLGMGLPGLKRMSETLSIHRRVGGGIRVTATKHLPFTKISAPAKARLGAATPVPAATSLDTEAAWMHGKCVRPFLGEDQAADVAICVECPGGYLLAIVDVSGHGPVAASLAQSIETELLRLAGSGLNAIFSSLHKKLQGTRGAAVGLAFAEAKSGSVSYLGVGNTRVAIVGNNPWNGISKDGVLGERLPTLEAQCAVMQRGDSLLMWTDGIPEAPGRVFAQRNSYRGPMQLARRMIFDLGRVYDDAGCVVLQWR